MNEVRPREREEGHEGMTKRTKASIKKEVRDIGRLLALAGKSVHNEETALI